MPDKTGIDQELQCLEEKLRGVDLPEPKLDRDCVLYQSGWAAAMAEVERGDLQSMPRISRRGSDRFWPMASLVGAVAASIMGLLLFLQTREGNTLRLELASIQNDIETMPIDLADNSHGAAGSMDRTPVVRKQESGKPAGVGFPQERVDLVGLVLNWPSNQIMTTSLFVGEKSAPVRFEGGTAWKDTTRHEAIRTHREMFNEMLSESQLF